MKTTHVGPLAVLAMLSCGSPTAPSFPTSVQMSAAIGPAPPVAITISNDTLRFTGRIGVNEPCYDFRAGAKSHAGALVVVLYARRKTGHCQQVLVAFDYTLLVSGVPSGSQRIRLVYDRHGPPTYTEAVLEQVVQVP